jgi:hypothetical protein
MNVIKTIARHEGRFFAGGYYFREDCLLSEIKGTLFGGIWRDIRFLLEVL